MRPLVFGCAPPFRAARLLLLAAFTGCLGACSAASQSQAPAPKAASNAAPAPASNVAVLRQLLSEVPAPGDLLSALPPDARKELDRQKAALSPEQRALLLEGTDPVVATRPLLYVAVGGTELSIVSLLFSSSAGSNELVGVLGERARYQGLIAASNALAARAAALTLAARVVDLAPGVRQLPEHLQQIALAARLLERTDIERAALRELAAPDGKALGDAEEAKWQVALAQLEARALEPKRAREHLARAVALLPALSDSTAPAEPHAAAAVAGTSALIESAERVLNAPAPELDGRVAAARAALELGLPERARVLLEPDKAEFGRHLAYSTTLARALTQGNGCPELWPTLVNEPLCRQAWSEALPRVSSAELDRAWASGQGRDVWAVETYLGFAFVVPMMYGLDRLGADATSEALTQTFVGLSTTATGARAVGEEFTAIALLARALGDAVVVAAEHPGEPAAIAPAERAALLSAANGLVSADAKPWARSAALAVAAIVAQQEATGPVLDGLRAADLGGSKLALGGLLLWDILADGNAPRFAELKPYFGELATGLDASAFARSVWLLQWAEAEAHLLPGEASYSTLERIAHNLSGPDVPLDLRLRAAIDRAGLLARTGEFASALKVLDPLIAQTPRNLVSNHQEQELLVAATGYQLVLQGLSAIGPERVERAKQLQTFLLGVSRANAAPPTLQMWLLMWGAEFEALVQRDACQGKAACERKIDRVRGADADKLALALGARVAGLLEHGVLPMGGVQVEIRYQPSGHLTPEVELSPSFLLAHVPQVVRVPKRAR